MAIVITVQAPSMNAFGFPDGANCQTRVNMIKVREKQNRKDNVGHGLVLPTDT